MYTYMTTYTYTYTYTTGTLHLHVHYTYTSTTPTRARPPTHVNVNVHIHIHVHVYLTCAHHLHSSQLAAASAPTHTRWQVFLVAVCIYSGGLLCYVRFAQGHEILRPSVALSHANVEQIELEASRSA